MDETNKEQERQKKRKRWKEITGMAVMVLLMLAIVLYLKDIAKLFGSFLGIVKPIFYGCLIAFILNVPLSAIERRLKCCQGKVKFLQKEKTRNAVSLAITLFLMILVIALLMLNVIPQLIDSVMNFTDNMDKNAAGLLAWFESLKIHFEPFEDYLAGIKWQDFFRQIASSMGGMMGGVLHGIPQIGSSIVSLCISVIIAIYILMDKKRLKRQAGTVLNAYTSEKMQGRVRHIYCLFADTYSDFLTGQCMESCILAALMFVALSIAGMPFAGIIAIMAGVFQLVPYVGAFLAWFIGAVLILFTAPGKVIFYLILFQIIQFCEAQFIYPRVVGGSVGLPPLFTLIAVFIGGKLFGLIGMLFFIPLMSVLYQLVSEDVRKKMQEKA